jgi:hypothetical protein
MQMETERELLAKKRQVQHTRAKRLVTAKLCARAGGGRAKERERGEGEKQEQGLSLPPVRKAGDVVSPGKTPTQKGEKEEAKQRNTGNLRQHIYKPLRDVVVDLRAERVNKFTVVDGEFVKIPFVGLRRIRVRVVTQKVKSSFEHVKMDAPLFEGV